MLIRFLGNALKSSPLSSCIFFCSRVYLPSAFVRTWLNLCVSRCYAWNAGCIRSTSSVGGEWDLALIPRGEASGSVAAGSLPVSAAAAERRLRGCRRGLRLHERRCAEGLTVQGQGPPSLRPLLDVRAALEYPPQCRGLAVGSLLSSKQVDKMPVSRKGWNIILQTILLVFYSEKIAH